MRGNPHQALHDMIKWNKCAMNCVVDVSFNMGESNWNNTLRSGIISTGGWIIQMAWIGRKKLLLRINPWMMSGCVQIAKRAAKCLRQSGPDQTVVNPYIHIPEYAFKLSHPLFQSTHTFIFLSIHSNSCTRSLSQPIQWGSYICIQINTQNVSKTLSLFSHYWK